MGMVSESQEEPATILIVDDARINRELMRMSLEKYGYHFILATNGKEAMEAVQGHPEVDLVLLDLLMPEMDGFAFLRWRNQHPQARSIPVIVNSSLGDMDSITQALSMGSYDYFTKPLSKRELETVLPLKIHNAVTARRLMAETSRQNEIMRRELEMAARYQEFLLPKRIDLPGVRVAYLFQPCSGVGGDYFDFIHLVGGQVGFVVADVSGHGVASAMTASIIKALLPGYLRGYRSPAQALTALNQDLVRLTQEDSFVTAFAALYDPGEQRLVWALAGHPSPFFLPRNSGIQALQQDTFFLGALDKSSPLVDYQDAAIEISPGDRLAFYTDGLTEAANPQGHMYGPKRLAKLLGSTRDKGVEQVRDLLQRDLADFVQGEFADDVAFILVEF